METVENADLAIKAVADMITMIAQHFGYDVPDWL
jgi:hypothetical protein